MNELFFFLSHVYGVPVNTYKTESFRWDYMRNNFPDVLERKYEECRRDWARVLEEQEKWTEFSPGQKVMFTDKGFQTIFGGSFDPERRRRARLPFTVEHVETVPNYCSCGLGDSRTFLVSVHPEEKCNLRRRHEMMHHQLVTIRLGEHEKKVTGFHLKRV